MGGFEKLDDYFHATNVLVTQQNSQRTTCILNEGHTIFLPTCLSLSLGIASLMFLSFPPHGLLWVICGIQEHSWFYCHSGAHHLFSQYTVDPASTL